jgi:hypothetical protein
VVTAATAAGSTSLPYLVASGSNIGSAPNPRGAALPAPSRLGGRHRGEDLIQQALDGKAVPTCRADDNNVSLGSCVAGTRSGSGGLNVPAPLSAGGARARPRSHS